MDDLDLNKPLLSSQKRRRKSQSAFEILKLRRQPKFMSKTTNMRLPPLDPGLPRRIVLVDSQGHASYVKVGKHTLVAELGVPYRDLRFMDPLVPVTYPASIFIREKALVINFEIIRMIITKNQVYVLSIPAERYIANLSKELCMEPSVDSKFVRYLSKMLGNPETSENPSSRRIRPFESRLAIDWDLPYELRAFEVGLSETVVLFDRQVVSLEDIARPALERLTRRVSPKELEDIREVKRIMNRLMQKVSRLRREIEKLLEDDLDMMDMYLSKKEEFENQEMMVNEGVNLLLHHNSVNLVKTFSVTDNAYDNLKMIEGTFASDESVRDTHSDTAITSTDAHGANMKQCYSDVNLEILKKEIKPNSSSDQETAYDNHSFVPFRRYSEKLLNENLAGGKGSGKISESASSSTVTHVDPKEVAGIEALLEAYLMQIEYICGRLLELKERIDDTEDLVDMDLDHRRNELHAMEVLITSITMIFTFVAMISGIFGMNLKNQWEDSHTAFLSVVSCSVIFAIAMFCIFMAYVVYRKLIFVFENSSYQKHDPEHWDRQLYRRSDFTW